MMFQENPSAGPASVAANPPSASKATTSSSMFGQIRRVSDVGSRGSAQ